MKMEETRDSIPTFMYRAGADGEVEKSLFDHPDDIPGGEGWTDSPANVAMNGAMPVGDGLSPPYEDHKFNALRQELKRRTGKGPRVGTSTDELVAMLEALDA